MSVGQTFECDRDANSIPELRKRHPGDLGKRAADMEARVPERLGQMPKVHARRVRDDCLASMLDDAAVVGSGCRASGGEASRSGAFRKGTDDLGEPFVEFETVDAPPQRDEQFAVQKIDNRRGRGRLVGHGCVAGQYVDGTLGQPERRAPVAAVAVVLDALLDEGAFEEGVRWS